jgi:NAD(P) transhydrogenase subunit alpha
MRLAVLKERLAGETRVAATPETVRKLVALGLSVAVEAGAGSGTSIPDSEYSAAGAEIAGDAVAALSGAGIVFAVQVPGQDAFAAIPRGALLVCISGAMADRDLVPRFAAAGVDVAALELLPRITRAQSMDILSSQANLAGYRAVIEGAAAFDRGFPMMMTAAGTVPPARVFVVGAGVAGLQAIATARRLGAIVSATDVRPAAKEEIKSLGATFVGVEDSETAGQTGAYARDMSAEFRQKQAELMAATVAKNDMVICTALVQGGRAPVLVTQAMVDAMKPGSVVVDLASDGGGNCAATRPGEAYVTDKGVKILGYRNWPGRISVAASALYAKNLLTFLTTFWDKAASAPRLPEDDAIIKGVMLTRGGAVVHAQFAAPVAAAPEPAAPVTAAESEHAEPATIEPEPATDLPDADDAASEIAVPATPITASAPQPAPEIEAAPPEQEAAALPADQGESPGATTEPPRGGGAKKKGPRANRPAGGKSPRAGES